MLKAPKKLQTWLDEQRSQHALDDLGDRIRRGVKSTVSDPAERGMQRWFVDSFIAGAFELRRHECADAAMQVYGVGHERSRELYDLVLLECRRLMIDDLPPRAPIVPGQLVGTRAQWMAPRLNLRVRWRQLGQGKSLIH